MFNPENAVPSPCVRNCCLDDDDACFGCHRSLGEIKEWGGADDARRLVILQNAAARRAAFEARAIISLPPGASS